MKLRGKHLRNVITLSEQPPTEFRVFAAGENEAADGERALWNARAAATTIANYQQQGVDLAIDLEHRAVMSSAADATDAMAWFQLEARADGLWAVGIKWTPEGEKRLLEKRQRYISPLFELDPDTGEILRLVNLALTSYPATYDAAPLIAASRLTQRGHKPMDPELISRIVALLTEVGSDESQALLAELAGTALGADPAAADGGDPAAEPPAEPVAATHEPGHEDEDEELDAAALADPPAEDAGAVMAAASRITQLADSTTLATALPEVEAWRQAYLTRDKFNADQAKIELAQRRDLVTALIKLGAETPATAWSGDAKNRKPRARFLSEPLDELRERVKVLRAAAPTLPLTPDGGDDKTPELTKRQLARCTQAGVDPKEYAINFHGIRRSKAS